jgi:NAD(P)-dependent dehydrogenase (short-subunit alcohol dehydrogenase family)
LVSTNLGGFVDMTRIAIKQMLSRNSGGSVVSITAALAENPIVGLTASVPMVTKGGITAISRSLAIKYAKSGIRAVAPEKVDTPLIKGVPRDLLAGLSPMGSISNVQEIVDGVI